MGFIKVATNTDLESRDLGTHVLLSAQRFKALEEKIEILEKKIDDMMEKERHIRRVITGALVTVATGTIVSVVTSLISYL